MKHNPIITLMLLITVLLSCSDSTEKTQPAENKTEITITKEVIKETKPDTIVESPALKNYTVTIEGKIIKAEDSGYPFTTGINVDTGKDTLYFLYFSEKYNESMLLNKDVTIRYINVPEYKHGGELSITGIHKIIDHGGDFPGMYSVTDKNGRSIEIETYIDDQEKALEGKETTINYHISYKKNIDELTVHQPIMNTLIYGNWNVIPTDSKAQGSRQIKIRPGSETSVYIDFGQGENRYEADVYSNVIEGDNFGGSFKLELVSEDPAIFEYSDDGRGHFEPIKKQKYQKPEGDFRKLLIGKWRHESESDGPYLEYTNKEIMADGVKTPYILSTVCMTEVYSDQINEKPIYISTLGGDENSEDDSQKDQCWVIVNVTEDALATQHIGAGSYTIYKRIK